MDIQVLGRMSIATECREIKRGRAPVRNRHRGPTATEEQVRHALEGRTYAQAARYLGYSYSGLNALIMIYGIKTHRRLTEEDRKHIVELIDSDMSRETVADKFERTPEYIGVIYRKMKRA